MQKWFWKTYIIIPTLSFDETFFVFDHNQAGMEMTVDLQIFDLSGRLVKQMSGNIQGTAFRSEPIRWNGTSDTGQKLPKGCILPPECYQ